MKLIALILVGLSVFASAAELEWKAAATKATITPKEPMWMAGYASRNKPADGTAQELFAKALAIEDAGGKRVVFVTLDLIGVPRTLHTALVQRLALKPEALLLNVSHTHCGPEFRLAGKPGIFAEFGGADKAEAYGKFLEDTLARLVTDALAQLAPAQLSYHHARCGFAMNRRRDYALPPEEPNAKLAPNPNGPVDQAVPVLRVADAAGKLRAVLFGYACHNTTLSFYQWCGDYAGYAQEFVEAEHPEAVALFVSGCGGDQNPYPRGRIELAQYHGRALATAVDAALQGPPHTLSGPLQTAFADVSIDFAPFTRATFEEELKSKDKYVAGHGRRLLERLEKDGKVPESYPYPVQTIRFGKGLTFIGLGGEVVVDYSLRLKRELTGGPVWVAGYCNDVMGYIPSKRVLEEGGYEGGDSMRYSSLPGRWAPTVEERIIGKVHELLGRRAP